LTSQDFLEIENSITLYENKLLENNKEDKNFEFKKELYNSFKIYIDNSKIDLFNNFIEKELNIFNQ
jgi:hypothetical protein